MTTAIAEPVIDDVDAPLKHDGAFFDAALSGFLMEHGRYPKADEGERPWQYRGWMLAILLAGQIENIATRWGYYIATCRAGKLLPEPIPQVDFGHTPNKQAINSIEKWQRIIETKDGSNWSSYNDLIHWLAFALGVEREPSRLKDAAQEALYRGVDIMPMIEFPYDYFGEYLAMRKAGGWNPNGFYPTPHPLCEMMVRMSMSDVPNKTDNRDQRTYSVCDPAVGTGRMLLHASNYSMNLWGQDVDRLVIQICKINGAMYAPWLAFGTPKHIVGEQTDPSIGQGDTLALRVSERLTEPRERTPAQNDPPRECTKVTDERGQRMLFGGDVESKPKRRSRKGK